MDWKGEKCERWPAGGMLRMLNGAGRCPTFYFFFFFSPPSHIAANCSIGHLPTFRQQLHKNSFFSWNLGPLLMCDLQRRLPINVVELFTVTSARGCQQPSLRRCRSVCAPLPLVIKTFPWGGVPAWLGGAGRGRGVRAGSSVTLRPSAEPLQSRAGAVLPRAVPGWPLAAESQQEPERSSPAKRPEQPEFPLSLRGTKDVQDLK